MHWRVVTDDALRGDPSIGSSFDYRARHLSLYKPSSTGEPQIGMCQNPVNLMTAK